jgi:hypothetical protein
VQQTGHASVKLEECTVVAEASDGAWGGVEDDEKRRGKGDKGTVKEDGKETIHMTADKGSYTKYEGVKG